MRLDAGFSQASAAAEINGYGEDSVQKAETGYQVPVDDLFTKLLKLYKVTEREEMLLGKMLTAARNATPVTRESADDWFKIEPVAAFIRGWAPNMIPGPLQNRDFALAMFLVVGMDPERAEAMADARVQRATILDRPQPTRVTHLIHEPLLYRETGSPEVMAGQMRHLLNLMDKPNVTIQIVREEAYFVGNDGQFEIASGRTIPDTLILSNAWDHVIATPHVVDMVGMVFEQIRAHALSVRESRAVLSEALEQWQSKQQ